MLYAIYHRELSHFKKVVWAYGIQSINQS